MFIKSNLFVFTLWRYVDIMNTKEIIICMIRTDRTMKRKGVAYV